MKTRHLIYALYLFFLITALMGPRNKAEIYYDISRGLQAFARKTGQLAIKLETKAFEEVNS